MLPLASIEEVAQNDGQIFPQKCVQSLKVMLLITILPQFNEKQKNYKQKTVRWGGGPSRSSPHFFTKFLKKYIELPHLFLLIAISLQIAAKNAVAD